jgi:hypothetical protein
MTENSSPGEQDQQPAELERLQRLHDAKQYQEVVDASAALIERWGESYRFHLLRGLSLMELRDFEGAISCFQKVQEMKPAEPRSVESLAWCLRKVGRIDDALPSFAEIFYTQPTYATATALLRVAFDCAEEDRPLMEVLLRFFSPDYFEQHPDHDIVMSPFVPFEAWCIANGIGFDVIDPGGNMYLSHVDGTPVEPYHAPPVKFATVPGASTIVGLDWLINPAGEFLDGSGLVLFKQLFGQRFHGPRFVAFAADPARDRVLHARAKGETYIDEDVLFLSAPLLHHFGHWIYDHLPRLMAWRRPGKAPLKLFTAASLPAPHRETLAHFGVQPADLIEAPAAGEHYRFRSATTLCLGDTQRPAPVLAKFLAGGLALKKEPLPPGAAGGRYFLERSQTARGRDIVNREALQAVLDEFGFQSIRRPDFTVAEQDAFFSEASIILSPFGSDVITFFQLRPGTDFVVLNFENMEEVYQGIEPIVPRYCALLGMRYHAVACGLVPRKHKMAYHGDMLVDCDALRRTLAGIVARRASRPDN